MKMSLQMSIYYYSTQPDSESVFEIAGSLELFNHDPDI